VTEDGKFREFKTFCFKDLLAYDFPIPDNDLIREGILKNDALLEIIGAAKSYKSFIANAFCIDLITGRNLFGTYRSDHGRNAVAFETVKKCRVLMIEQEIGAQDLRDRLRPLYGSLSPGEKMLMEENLFTHSFDHTIQLDSAAGVGRLFDLVEEYRPNVLILDPLVEFHTTNENDTQGMAKIARVFDYLREKFNPLAIIFTHHEGHPTAILRDGIGRGRGSSVIPGKIDSAINVSVFNRATLQLKIDFTIRRGKPIDSLHVQVNQDTLRPNFLYWHRDKTKGQKTPGNEVYKF